MAITIKGISIKSIAIEKKDDSSPKVTGDYELMSSIDMVLAKQSFNGYSDLAVKLSSKTAKALIDFKDSLKADVEAVLGLDLSEEKK